MELHQLRGFVMVARTGSFTRAAEALYLTQPALSLQVKALEAHVGKRLFLRQGNRLTLTDAGRTIQPRLDAAFAELAAKKQQNAVPHILWAGRLIGWKHPEAAVEAAQVLKLHDVPFSLEIIGEGPLGASLEQKIAS